MSWTRWALGTGLRGGGVPVGFPASCDGRGQQQRPGRKEHADSESDGDSGAEGVGWPARSSGRTKASRESTGARFAAPSSTWKATR